MARSTKKRRKEESDEEEEEKEDDEEEEEDDKDKPGTSGCHGNSSRASHPKQLNGYDKDEDDSDTDVGE